MIAVGLIGHGGIARDTAAILGAPSFAGQVHIVGVVARPGRAAAARAVFADIPAVETAAALVALRPSVVVEAAGHGALMAHGAAVLQSGIDLIIVSTGALADRALLDGLREAAAAGGARMLLPAGAIGGVDAIAAMRLGGLASVRYRAVKPPLAWRGSPAERLLDLDHLAARAVFYEGTARAAALDYPQNANVAATVALAGLGFEANSGRARRRPRRARQCARDRGGGGDRPHRHPLARQAVGEQS